MVIPEIDLGKGIKIPQIGLGLWLNKDETQCKESVKFALDGGYRHFDTAQIYKNEQFLGSALRASGINRKELFITTKIWNDNQFWDDIEPSLDESLSKLQTDYVDLLLLHFPVTETRRPAWRKMEDILTGGNVKSIGVSNYTVKHLEELLKDAAVNPAVSQVELHVYLQQPELVEFCKQKGIALEAYSPLAHGENLGNAELQKIAQEHNKSVPQIMLRWCIEQGFIILPKSVHKERIQENIDVFDFALDKQDMSIITSLNTNLRTCWDPTHVS